MQSKLQLSQKEKDLVNNTDWILTKQEIIKKIYHLFGELYSFQKEEIAGKEILFPSNAVERSGKISKGDNYLGLPYVILDYPALFEKENLFVVRTMFWWGNFFSVTLHSSGINKLPVTTDTIQFLAANNFFICVNEKEWDHHFEKNNYMAAGDLTATDLDKLSNQNFFKIAKKISLDQLEDINIFLTGTFREILNLLQFNYQGGKTDLLPVSPTTGSGL